VIRRMVAQIAMLLCALMLVSCGGPSKVSLGLRLKEGETYGLKAIVEQEVSQTVGDRELQLTQIMTMGCTYEVLRVDDEGVMDIEMTYRSYRVESESPAGR